MKISCNEGWRGTSLYDVLLYIMRCVHLCLSRRFWDYEYLNLYADFMMPGIISYTEKKKLFLLLTISIIGRKMYNENSFFNLINILSMKVNILLVTHK